MINKTILSFCLFALLFCVVRSSKLLNLKVEKRDFTFCPAGKEFYTVDLENHFFSFDEEKFPNQVLNEYLITDTVNGYSYFDQPKSFEAGLFLDQFINLTVYDGYARQPNANISGAETLGTYLCSYTFIETGLQPCNILCDSLIKRVQPFEYKNITIVPTLEECLASGSDSNTCSAIGLTGLLANFKPIIPEYIPFDKYPGGVVRGSLLGFGVLVGILLVIGTMGIIMKQQNK